MAVVLANEKRKPAQDDENTKKYVKLYKQRIAAFEENCTPFPIRTNNILGNQGIGRYFHLPTVMAHMKSSYPLLHGSVIILMHRFIQIKARQTIKTHRTISPTQKPASPLVPFLHRTSPHSPFFHARPLSNKKQNSESMVQTLKKHYIRTWQSSNSWIE